MGCGQVGGDGSAPAVLCVEPRQPSGEGAGGGQQHQASHEVRSQAHAAHPLR